MKNTYTMKGLLQGFVSVRRKTKCYSLILKFTLIRIVTQKKMEMNKDEVANRNNNKSSAERWQVSEGKR
jgi:hypothetical protein